MSRSPYDGESRAVLRVGLAVVCGADLLTLALELDARPAGAGGDSLAPRLLLDLGGSTAPLVALTAVGLGALLLFARSRAPLWAAPVALAILGVLCEATAALAGGPRRNYFAAGAALLGWSCGAAFARALGKARPPADPDRVDALAEAGAVAALAATYIDAAFSKLTTTGFRWADEVTLRAVVASHHELGDRSWLGLYARFLLDQPGLSRALSFATLAIQAGAVLYAFGGPRLRASWAVLLFSFHLNVELLTGIDYWEARDLVLLFGFPWPSLARTALGWVGRRRPAPRPPRGAEGAPVPLPFAVRAAGVVLVVIAAAWLSPIRRYLALHHALSSPAAR